MFRKIKEELNSTIFSLSINCVVSHSGVVEALLLQGILTHTNIQTQVQQDLDLPHLCGAGSVQVQEKLPVLHSHSHK